MKYTDNRVFTLTEIINDQLKSSSWSSQNNKLIAGAMAGG